MPRKQIKAKREKKDKTAKLGIGKEDNRDSEHDIVSKKEKDMDKSDNKVKFFQLY